VTGELISVNVGVRTVASWASEAGYTGIDKRPAAQRVRLTPDGVVGDVIGDRRHHGGVDQAVYAYAAEDAQWWEAEMGCGIPPGSFGENLTTSGVDVTGAVVGERWAIGGALLEVCQPRIPCGTFAGFWGEPDLVKRFTAHGAPGAYLRVLSAGEVGAGDPVTIAHRPAHGVTIGEVFRSNTDASLLPRLLLAPELPEKVREKAARRLARTPA
jgi:MOSC domain-containing protein YiiM